MVQRADDFTVTSSVNNTSTPLAGAATFTGTGEYDVRPDVMVSCQTDVAGTLYFDFSVDGTNWGAFPVAGFTVAPGIHEFHTAVKGPRWFRARFVNGAATQTYFRLYSYFGMFAKTPNAPLNQAFGSDSDAMLVRLGPDFFTEVVRGQVNGYTVVQKFGRNSDIDIVTTPEDVWEGGGLYTGQPAHTEAAETLDITSSSTADTSAGTGARTIRISGLDANWLEATEDITMNGTTDVTTVSTWRRLFRVQVLTAGSGEANAGTLSVEGSDSSAVYAAVPAGLNQSQLAVYTIPANTQGIMVGYTIAMARANGSAGSANVSLLRRPEGGVYNAIRNHEIVNGQAAELTTLPLKFDAMDDIRIRVESVSDNNTIVNASFDIMLIML